MAVGVAPSGAMDVSQRAEDIGWYQLGPRPGSRGNAVLAGHLNWQGKVGVFAPLCEMRRGDLVAVRAADGETRAYHTQWIEEYPADNAPVAKVFEPLDDPALTLITCGGYWNPATRRCSTRVVARATRSD